MTADPHRFARDESVDDACQICGHGSAHRDHDNPTQPVVEAGPVGRGCPHPASYTRDGCEICDACHVVLSSPPGTVPGPVDAAGADDGAVEKMADLIHSCDAGDSNNRVGVSAHDECYVLGRYTSRRLASQILAAIRRGDVPGIWATRLDPEKVRKAHMEEIASLKARLEEAEKACSEEIDQRDALAEHLLRAVNAFDPDWEWSNLKTPLGAVALIYEHAHGYDVVVAERDRLAARVGELTRERDAAHDAVSLRDAQERAAHDKALAELAGLKARKVTLPQRFEIDAVEGHGRFGSPEATLEVEANDAGAWIRYSQTADAIRAAGVEVDA